MTQTSQLICGKCGCKKWAHRQFGVLKLQTCVRCGNPMRKREDGE
jgi:ribosomal protein S27AE